MSQKGGVRAPAACRGFLRAASWIVPGRLRSEWRARWQSRLSNWWLLVERGELSSRTMSDFHRALWSDAAALRFRRVPVDNWLRSPGVVLASAAAALVLLAMLTNGFAATRLLLAPARLAAHPTAAFALSSPYNRLMAHAIAFGFALLTGAVAIGVVRMPVHRHNLRYWAFLLAKCAAAAGIVTLLWLEGGPVLRKHLVIEELRAIVGGLLLTVAYVAAFTWAIIWCVRDQRRRCPVCLRRLAMPVRMGSWASTFDPPTTEMLCDIGHGRLSICECADGESERWAEMDPSWRELFEAHR